MALLNDMHIMVIRRCVYGNKDSWLEMRTVRACLAEGKGLSEDVRWMQEPVLGPSSEGEEGIGGIEMTKQKAPETEDEFNQYEHDLEEYILNNWKKKGTVTDEKESREYISEFLFFLSVYAPICLVKTILEVDDLKDEFNKRYDWKD